MVALPTAPAPTWNKSGVTDSQFRAVWRAYDGATHLIARQLHLGQRTVRTRASYLGLKKAGYLTASEAGIRLGVSSSQVSKWCRDGSLPAVRNDTSGKHFWRITPEAVEEFRPKIATMFERPFVVEDGYLTAQQLANRLGYDVASIRDFLRRGVITGTKTARRDWRIHQDEVERVADEIAEMGRPEEDRRVRRPKLIARRMRPDVLSDLLRKLTERYGLTIAELARRVEIDASHLKRLMAGTRMPSAALIHSIARELRLSDLDHNRLLVCAGFAPRQVVLMGGWDEALEAVVALLGDSDLSARERSGFREEIIATARRWRRRSS